MPIHIVRIGSPRLPDEGLRIGTVRRPTQGVPKAEFASRDFYDVRQPLLSPSAELVAQAKAAEDEKAWEALLRKFKAEMNKSRPRPTAGSVGRPLPSNLAGCRVLLRGGGALPSVGIAGVAEGMRRQAGYR